MVRRDPYTPNGGYHKCMDCHNRIDTGEHGGMCPECGGAMQNLAVARE